MSIEDLEKRIRAIEDLEDIKRLHQKYVNLMDNLHYDKVFDLFTEDAEVEVRNSGVKRGKNEIAEIYLSIIAKTKGTLRDNGHLAIAPDIAVDGDIAKGTWLIYMLFCKLSIQWVQGLNECEYRRENEGWKISKLKFTRTLASDPSLYPYCHVPGVN